MLIKRIGDLHYNLLADGTAVLRGRYADITGELVLPEYIEAIGRQFVLTCIDSLALSGSSITSIIIPNSVKEICRSAFCRCKKLKSIVLPEGIKKLDQSLFESCIKLREVILPHDITEITYCMFAGCTSLVNVTIPGNVETIDRYAFWSCTSLTNINIPKNVKVIGSHAFENCFSLISVTIPEGVTTIGSGAFTGCSSLTSVTIPEGVTTIEDSAFFGCTSLDNVKLPNQITTIENSTFAHCYKLYSIIIPTSVQKIKKEAFYYCKSLSNITLAERKRLIKIEANAFSFTAIQLEDFLIHPMVKYYKQLEFGIAKNLKAMLLDIYKCKEDFGLEAANWNWNQKSGDYSPDLRIIRVDTTDSSMHSLSLIAIHEYAHHLHHTEFVDYGESVHGKEFWGIHTALMYKAVEKYKNKSCLVDSWLHYATNDLLYKTGGKIPNLGDNEITYHKILDNMRKEADAYNQLIDKYPKRYVCRGKIIIRGQ